MQSTARRSLVRRLVTGVGVLSTLALVSTGVAVAVSGLPRTSPVPSAPPTASLPDGVVDPGACGAAVASVRTCNLVASAGNVTLPGALPTDAPISVPIWSFTTSGAPAVPVGPTLVALANETITINVLNSLPALAGNLSIEVPGAATATADSTGVASGGTATWTAAPNTLAPGTYIYGAGQQSVASATDNSDRQVAMGLVGTLIVRPADFDQTTATPTRYDVTGSSANGCSAIGASGFTAEALVQVSELSTEFNNDVAVGTPHGLTPYEPNYFLINGVPYTSSAPTIDVAQGDCVLVRYADVGNSEHSMGPVGARQLVIAQDDRAMVGNTPRSLDAEYLTPGQTADALVQVSANAHIGNQIPVMDLGRFLHNDLSSTAATPSLGGAAIAINVVAETVAASALGPSSRVVVTPSTDSGAVDLSGTATFSSLPTSATWYLDTVGGAISGPVDVNTGLFTVPAATSFTSSLDGDHIVWVQATDANGPGSPGGDVFTLNKTGPSVYALTVDPPVSNGTTQDKPAGALPDLAATSYTAPVGSTPAMGTLDFGTANPGLAVGEPIQILGLSPAGWNGNFTVASISFNTLTFAFMNDPGANADQSVLPAPVVTGGAQQVSSDVLVSGTAEPSLADWSISKIDWCVMDGASCSLNPNLNGTQTIFDPAITVPPSDPPSPGAPVAIAIDIPAADVGALADGTYPIRLIATESSYTIASAGGIDTYTQTESRQNNTPVDPAATVNLVVDHAGPVASITTVSPEPAGVNSINPSNLNYYNGVRIDAHLTDASNIANAQLFVTGVGDPAPGSVGSPWVLGGGTQMTPRNSVWTGTALDVYGDVPSAEFTAYPQGPVKLWVVGQDEAGNWGTPVSHTLQLDETAPIVLATPAATVPTASIMTGASCPAGQSPCGGTLVFTGQDPLLPTPAPAGWQPFSSGIVAVEWQVGFLNAVDLGGETFTAQATVTDVSATPSVAGGPVVITMPFSGGPTPYTAGAQIIYRVRDAAGNYSGFYETTIPVPALPETDNGV